MKRFKGTTDTVNTCECCGRKDLKKTYVIETEAGLQYLGSECFSKAFSVSMTYAELKARRAAKNANA